MNVFQNDHGLCTEDVHDHFGSLSGITDVPKNRTFLFDVFLHYILLIMMITTCYSRFRWLIKTTQWELLFTTLLPGLKCYLPFSTLGNQAQIIFKIATISMSFHVHNFFIFNILLLRFFPLISPTSGHIHTHKVSSLSIDRL